jgi:hypothetical protein
MDELDFTQHIATNINASTANKNTTLNAPNTWTVNSSWSSSQYLFHNPYGPAAFTKAEAKWYIEGKQISSTAQFCHLANHTNETTLLWMLTYGDTLPSNPKDIRHIETDINP